MQFERLIKTKGTVFMFIEKYAERVENYIAKHFRRSTLVNFLYLFIFAVLEILLAFYLNHASFSHMLIVKIASVLLWADANTRYYFAAWIFFTTKLKEKENKKWLKAMQCFLLFAAVMFFIGFCISAVSIFS